jgi:hypothetical protein
MHCGCPVCECTREAIIFCDAKFPDFLRARTHWLLQEYKTYIAKGLDRHHLSHSLLVDGTLVFSVKRRAVSYYEVVY